ncbi:CTB family bacteriocin [Acaryochloris sp. IP29b_bin.148]|uniref:CTB family bacteriocin n=1 Tax=Acaryochloris sp. IP29b_bin.148 TaxID=2969218 RepID=UPI002631F98C|nr:CTB family bacteriocin [Acaryochloris sp. IP29b_bin.148]
MSELFTELSDQQQELVAGGAVTTLNINETSFYSNTELLSSVGGATSGPGGSASFGAINAANQEVYTDAKSVQFGAVD